MYNLIRLNLSNMNVKGNELTILTKLQFLNVTNTKVSDAGIYNLTRLQTLEASNTDITDIGICGLTNLKSLDINSTKISDKGISTLTKLTFLASIDTFISGSCFSMLTNLHILGISNQNKRKTYDEMMSFLMDRRNSDSEETEDKYLSNLIGLRALVLVGINISGSCFSKLKNLEHLDLRNSRFDQNLDYRYFKFLTNLHALQLNTLMNSKAMSDFVIACGSLTNLQSLFLEKNEIPNEYISMLTNIKKLSIRGSCITRDCILQLTNLQTLHIHCVSPSQEIIETLKLRGCEYHIHLNPES
jgi:hypothetical protein